MVRVLGAAGCPVQLGWGWQLPTAIALSDGVERFIALLGPSLPARSRSRDRCRLALLQSAEACLGFEPGRNVRDAATPAKYSCTFCTVPYLRETDAAEV